MQADSPSSLGDILARIFWMLIGPALLAVFGLLIVRTGNGWLTGYDFAFLAVLASLAIARWLEFRSGHPHTSDGTPATPEHLRRYVIGVAVLGLLAWVISNVLGNYVMAS